MNRHWWYSVTLFVASGIFSGVTIANAVYFSRAKTNCSSINRGQANTMFWLNVILAVIMILIFLWSIFNIIYTEEGKAYLKGVVPSTTTTTTTTAIPIPTTTQTVYPTGVTPNPVVTTPVQSVGGVVYPVTTPVRPVNQTLVATSPTAFADAVNRNNLTVAATGAQSALVGTTLPNAFSSSN